jgi:hypothetical protein
VNQTNIRALAMVQMYLTGIILVIKIQVLDNTITAIKSTIDYIESSEKDNFIA